MILKTTLKSDLVGAVSSGLCILHCVATPFLFIAQSCNVSGCCASSPAWWSAIDYLFIGITFLAVYQSGKNTSKPWIKYAMYTGWIVLSLLTFNEKFTLIPLASAWKYLAAFSLISLHLYNLKYCQCVEEACCANA